MALRSPTSRVTLQRMNGAGGGKDYFSRSDILPLSLLVMVVPLLLPPLDMHADIDEAYEGGGAPEPDVEGSSVGCCILFDNNGKESFPMSMPIFHWC